MSTLLPTPKEQHVLQFERLQGKVAVVTGGTRGIGLAVIQAYAEAGADVAIIYRSASDAAETAAKIASEHGVRVRAYQCDIADKFLVDETFERIVSDFSGLDIVVANAGVASNFAAEDTTPEMLSNIMSINFNGAFWCARKAVEIWKRDKKFGNVIFTTSMSATIVNIPEKQAVYNASKAGLLHLANSLAVEWLGICRVNCISPGYIATEMIGNIPEDVRKAWVELTPSKRMGLVHELKGAYVFCASDASSFMTGGHLVIDGGYTLP